MRATSYLFPVGYLIFWVPAALMAPTELRFWISALNVLLAIAIGHRTVSRIGKFGILSLSIFVLFSIIVRSAVCSADGRPFGWELIDCAGRTARATISVAIALVTTFTMAAALEWRGSLLATVNGFRLPRDIKVISAIAGSLLGDFSRASTRVHHATTARGDAAPGFSFRNLLALPGLVVNIWTSVLTSVGERLSLQWASDEFWDRYIPSKFNGDARKPILDLLVAGMGLALLTTVIADRISPFI